MTEQVTAFIENVSNFHLDLANHYYRLSQRSFGNEKTNNILLYIYEQEIELARRSDEQLRQRSYLHILNTWLKERPNNPKIDFSMDASFNFVNANGLEDVFEDIVNQRNYIINAYHQLANIVSAESLETFFDSLAEIESQNLKKLVRNIKSYEDT